MRHRRSLPLAAVLTALVALPAAASANATGGTAVAPSASGGAAPTGQTPIVGAPGGTERGAADMPASYRRLYRAAARARGLDWRLLAAIGKNESDHGRARLPGIKSGLNFARCCAGPMQFCTVKRCGDTWSAYAVDGNRDGQASVYDPADAIPAAAALLANLQRMLGAHPDFLLAAYNAGPAYLLRHRRVPPYRETQAYVRNGLAYLRQLPR